jgi:hypothetical protein
MSDHDNDDDVQDAAEERAAELLALMATAAPEISATFAPALIARARAQGAVAPPLRAFGGFLLALAAAAAAAAQAAPLERRR